MIDKYILENEKGVRLMEKFQNLISKNNYLPLKLASGLLVIIILFIVLLSLSCSGGQESSDFNKTTNTGIEQQADMTTTEKVSAGDMTKGEATSHENEDQESAKVTTDTSSEMTTEVVTEDVTTETTMKQAVTTIATESTSDTTTKASTTQQPPTQATTVPSTQATTEKKEVSYSPERVAKLANDKVKAAGMILLPENLDEMLANGKITQEEYDEYYPYDGCGYYSVFIETDLNQAKTISGRALHSEEEIAEHIADMLVLETEPYVYVDYNGIYTLNGTDFYEFRCYR